MHPTLFLTQNNSPPQIMKSTNSLIHSVKLLKKKKKEKTNLRVFPWSSSTAPHRLWRPLPPLQLVGMDFKFDCTAHSFHNYQPPKEKKEKAEYNIQEANV